jgi:hypothetical protein
MNLQNLNITATPYQANMHLVDLTLGNNQKRVITCLKNPEGVFASIASALEKTSSIRLAEPLFFKPLQKNLTINTVLHELEWYGIEGLNPTFLDTDPELFLANQMWQLMKQMDDCLSVPNLKKLVAVRDELERVMLLLAESIKPDDWEKTIFGIFANLHLIEAMELNKLELERQEMVNELASYKENNLHSDELIRAAKRIQNSELLDFMRSWEDEIKLPDISTAEKK